MVSPAGGPPPLCPSGSADIDAAHLWTYRLGRRVEEATLRIYRDKVYCLAADGYVHAVE